VNASTRARLFRYDQAFDHPVTLWVTVAITILLVLAPLVVLLLAHKNIASKESCKELLQRCVSWIIIVPLLLGPILLGAFWTILGVGVLSLFCYSEFARATGLFREKAISTVVTLGIVLLTFASLDNWYAFFVALTPLVIAMLAAVAILRDQPKGYIQRVALGVFGFVLFGICMGHLGLIADGANYRPYLIFLFLAVELNDVFAYLSGKTLGQRKLAPHTSPNKTLGGSVGAIVLTTLLVLCLGRFVFHQSELASWPHLVVLGILISVAGQFGDLMLSSIKRDIGIKDMGVTIPGHGGLLDRFDSIILAAPVVYHYINYFVGVGADQTQRIFTGA
jgi:phosphatidate cytidylyltransferase